MRSMAWNSYVPNLFHVSATGKKGSSEAVAVQKDPRNVHHGGPAQNYAACYPQLYLPANWRLYLKFHATCFCFSVWKWKKQQKVKATQRITAYNRKKGYRGLSTAGPHKPLHINDGRLLCMAGCDWGFRALFHHIYKYSTATSCVVNGCKIYNA